MPFKPPLLFYVALLMFALAALLAAGSLMVRHAMELFWLFVTIGV